MIWYSFNVFLINMQNHQKDFTISDNYYKTPKPVKALPCF